MKKNLGMFFGLSRCGAGAVLMGLCAFIPVSRADLVINNEGYSSNGGGLNSVNELAIAFTAGASGDISSLSLDLYVNPSYSGTAEVDLFSFNGSLPGSFSAEIGTVNIGTSGNNVVNLIGNPYLASGTSYAIVLQPSTSATQWQLTQTAGSGVGASGSIVGDYYYMSGAWNKYSTTPATYLQMNLSTTPVPEVPMTGMVMGFGALAIALGRKLRTAVSSVA